MQICPRCGSETADHAPYCPACGQAMRPPSPAPEGPGQAQPNKKTMLGIAPGASPPAGQPAGVGKKTVMGMGMPMPGAAQPGRQGVGHQTVIGMPMQEAMQQPAPQQPAPQQPQQPAPQQIPPKNRTMMGMAPPEVAAAADQRVGNKTMLGVPSPTGPQAQPPQQPYQPQVQQQPPPQGQQQHQPQGQPLPSDKRTMMGVAMPGIAPTHEPKAPPTAQPLPSDKRTMMGVAMPGIAPTHEPGAAQPQPQGAPRYPSQAPPVPPPEAAAHQPPSSKPKRARVVVATPPLYRRPAFVLALLGVSAIVVVGLFALLWPTKPPIASQALVNEEGKDMLRLTCPTCPDGTVMTVNGATAKTTSSVADVTLPEPLAVGDNAFTVQIDRPGDGRDESVELHVPVAFRVRPDLTGLQSQPPTFHVEVQAAPGTNVLIDGTSLKLDDKGMARYPVDVSEACSGPSAEVVTIDRDVPYSIQPRDGDPSAGKVAVKVGVTPLTLQAPRPHMVVDSEHFLVAGRTSRGATVEIEGAKFPAGADGSFSRKMQIKRPGETQVRVRSTLPDHAPRTITFTVKRVADLEAEAETFASRAKTDVRSLLANAAAFEGKEVVIRGEVVEARSQGFVRIVLLDAAGQCDRPPCLARLVYAGRQALDQGEKVRVFGRVAGAHTQGGKSVPEIDVDFLLKAR